MDHVGGSTADLGQFKSVPSTVIPTCPPRTGPSEMLFLRPAHRPASHPCRCSMAGDTTIGTSQSGLFASFKDTHPFTRESRDTAMSYNVGAVDTERRKRGRGEYARRRGERQAARQELPGPCTFVSSLLRLIARSVGRGARIAKTIGTAVERQAAEPETSTAHISCRDAPERAVCWG